MTNFRLLPLYALSALTVAGCVTSGSQRVAATPIQSPVGSLQPSPASLDGAPLYDGSQGGNGRFEMTPVPPPVPPVEANRSAPSRSVAAVRDAQDRVSDLF